MTSLSWGHLTIVLSLVIVVVIVAALILRRWRRDGVDTMIGLTLSGSAFFAAVSLVGAVITFVNLMLQSQIEMTVPVEGSWPTPPESLTITTTGPTAQRASGGFTDAHLWIENLSTGTRILWASGQALGMLVPAVIAALIAVACFQLLRGRAFAPVVARMALITAAIVLVGGILAPTLSDLAGSLASTELFRLSGAEVSGLPDGWDWQMFLPRPTMRLGIPAWPVGAALGFAALAAVMRFGSRLQHDTEGLV